MLAGKEKGEFLSRPSREAIPLPICAIEFGLISAAVLLSIRDAKKSGRRDRR